MDSRPSEDQAAFAARGRSDEGLALGLPSLSDPVSVAHPPESIALAPGPTWPRHRWHTREEGQEFACPHRASGGAMGSLHERRIAGGSHLRQRPRDCPRFSRHENASWSVRPGPGLRSGDPGQPDLVAAVRSEPGTSMSWPLRLAGANVSVAFGGRFGLQQTRSVRIRGRLPRSAVVVRVLPRLHAQRVSGEGVPRSQG